MVVEVDYTEGYRPGQTSASRMVLGLQAMLDKPDGVALHVDEVLVPDPEQVWTQEELDAVFAEHAGASDDKGELRIHTLFVDGRADEESDDEVFGWSWGGDKVVVFAATIQTACEVGPPGTPELLRRATETTVWAHEVGHLMGLVDDGTPMVTDHRDPDNGNHDIDESCVMHWSANRDQVVERMLERISGGNQDPLDFDDACRADLAASVAAD
jgi:hypothetical protein